MRSLLWTSRRRDAGGANAVEFALIAAFVLFPLLLGIIQFGFLLWAKQAGASAAREVVRQAAVGRLDCAQFETFVADKVPHNGTLDATRTFGMDAFGDDSVTVTVKFTNTFGINFFPFVDGKIAESAEARVESTTDDSVDCP